MKTKDEKLQCLFKYLKKKNIEYYFGEAAEYENYDHDFVLAIDWNGKPNGLQEFVKSLDTSTDWSDEVAYCNACGGIIHTTPRCYGDQLDFICTDNACLCRKCIEDNSDEYIEFLIDNDRHCAKVWAEKLIEDADFRCLGDVNERAYCQIFENGFHPGQTDTPQGIIKAVSEEFGFPVRDKYDTVWFLNDVGQFDIHFSLWLRERKGE